MKKRRKGTATVDIYIVTYVFVLCHFCHQCFCDIVGAIGMDYVQQVLSMINKRIGIFYIYNQKP